MPRTDRERAAGERLGWEHGTCIWGKIRKIERFASCQDEINGVQYLIGTAEQESSEKDARGGLGP